MTVNKDINLTGKQQAIKNLTYISLLMAEFKKYDRSVEILITAKDIKGTTATVVTIGYYYSESEFTMDWFLSTELTDLEIQDFIIDRLEELIVSFT
jgi:voltage-gated potassium channel Kch